MTEVMPFLQNAILPSCALTTPVGVLCSCQEATKRLSWEIKAEAETFGNQVHICQTGRKGIVRYQPKGRHVLGPIRSDAPCRECVQPGLNMKGNIKMVKNILTGRLGIQLGMTPVQESRFNVPYQERRREWSQKN